MDIEELINKHEVKWLGHKPEWRSAIRAALTELAAGYEQKIAGLESEAILSRALSERIRQLEAERVPDGCTADELAEFLLTIGWNSPLDAQWSRIKEAMPKLRAMLAAAPQQKKEGE